MKRDRFLPIYVHRKHKKFATQQAQLDGIRETQWTEQALVAYGAQRKFLRSYSTIERPNGKLTIVNLETGDQIVQKMIADLPPIVLDDWWQIQGELETFHEWREFAGVAVDDVNPFEYGSLGVALDALMKATK